MAGSALIEQIPTPPEAPAAFAPFHDRPFGFFLDSGMTPDPGSELGRYSFFGSDPFLVMKSRGREITLLQGGTRQVIQGDPFEVLADLIERYSLPADSAPVPFAGGAVGYLSYDLCHFVERLPATTTDDLNLPEAFFAFYDTVVAFDHHRKTSCVISTGFPESDAGRREERARRRLEETRAILGGAGWTFPNAPESQAAFSLSSNFTRQGYLRTVEKAREYICAGDIFQVNLSQRLEAELPIAPYDLFLRLREVNPAPFACYLSFGEVSVVSASPERFLKLRGDRVETRPIKGTRPRGRDASEDSLMAGQLVGSAKDQAEHIMIVDLERNDLGRVCQFGSVRVPQTSALETFPTVFHLTSTVEGRLRPGKSRLDLLKATFPGGSITGAPKVRAMEIIDELEPTRRGIYTGSIGYLSFTGEMDLNIAIRTFVIKNGRAYFHAGGGIVYDSRPEAEYEETLDKARALIQALRISPAVMVEAA